MKFNSTITKRFQVKIPPLVIQAMNLEPGDVVEITVEHFLVIAIAKSARFVEVLEEFSTAELQAYRNEFNETGGQGQHGEFESWLIKKLRLGELGLEFWTGKGSIKDTFPNGLLPVLKI